MVKPVQNGKKKKAIVKLVSLVAFILSLNLIYIYWIFFLAGYVACCL